MKVLRTQVFFLKKVTCTFFSGENEDGKPEDVDKLLQDEMLDSCDSPAIRKIVKGSFLAVFADLCKRIDEITAKLNSYINEKYDSVSKKYKPM